MHRLLPLIALLLIQPPSGAAESVYRIDRAQKEVILKGYTRSRTKATLSSEVSGKVLQVNYETGDVITDIPLIVIDTTFIDLNIKQSQHAIDILRLTLKRHQSRTAYLTKEYRRIDTLFQQNSTAESQRDAAAEDLRQAELQVASTKAQIEQHQTELKELSERRRRHRVSAPTGWVVTQKHVEINEIVQPDEPLAEVADYRNLVVPLAVSSQELKAISAMPRPLSAYVEGLPAAAEINWINPAFDEASRKLNIEFILTDYDGINRGGLVFTLPLVIASDGLRVPQAAVISRYENPRVRLQSSGETVPVIIIDENNDHYIIAEDGKLLPGMVLSTD